MLRSPGAWGETPQSPNDDSSPYKGEPKLLSLPFIGEVPEQREGGWVQFKAA